MITTQNKYVAFCDILGFSNSVTSQFEKTISIYKEFKHEVSKQGFLKLKTSIYSDSIFIEGENLIDVAKTVQILLWTSLRYDWLIRGGIAYGKHWKESDKNNLFIVSEGLVKAVNIEKTIKHPIIAISSDISIGIDYWTNGFFHSVFDLPIIHYNEYNIVNPFNNYWFKSAELRLLKLKSLNPEHLDKYNYLLKLVDDIKTSKTFIPMDIINDLLSKGLLKKLEFQL